MRPDVICPAVFPSDKDPLVFHCSGDLDTLEEGGQAVLSYLHSDQKQYTLKPSSKKNGTVPVGTTARRRAFVGLRVGSIVGRLV